MSEVKKEITTTIVIDENNYIEFSQNGDKELKEIIIKFDGELTILNNEQIIPFFSLIERVKKEMSEL